MSRERINAIIDFGNPLMKRKLMDFVRCCHDAYQVELSPKRPIRSLKANAYYWAAVVQPFFEYLSEQDERVTCAEQAHEILKTRFLSVDRVDQNTGEVIISFTRSTTDLDTAEFTDYVERCRSWLADFFHIVTLDPNGTVAA